MTTDTHVDPPRAASTDEAADADAITAAVRLLQTVSYNAAVKAGWHTDPDSGKLRTPEDNEKLCTHYLMLAVTELAEAVDGNRRGLMDDKLPHRLMEEVEIADALIRLLNYGGSRGFDLGAAVAEKLAYNATRADHSPAARAAVGGKKY